MENDNGRLTFTISAYPAFPAKCSGVDPYLSRADNEAFRSIKVITIFLQPYLAALHTSVEVVLEIFKNYVLLTCAKLFQIDHHI